MLALQPAGASMEEGLRGVREQARRLNKVLGHRTKLKVPCSY